jgi:ethanolamine permease
LAALFLNPDYRIGIWGALIWFLCGMAYFAFYARRRLILSPEEQFALNLEASAQEASP